MKVSTKGRYALRLMIDLARQGDAEYTTLRDISLRQSVSVKYLEQITARLCKMGLLASARGPQGGYKLARSPGEYTAGEILQVTEGSLAPVACLESNPEECAHFSDCATLRFWKGLQRAVDDYVFGVTLADLAFPNDSRDDGAPR